MTIAEAIFYSVAVICATPVLCLVVIGMLGISLSWETGGKKRDKPQ